MTSNSTQILLLNELEKGFSGISVAWGKLLCEASSYCFDFQKHKNGVEMLLKGDSETNFQVVWENEITEQTRNAWNDTQDLTEFGASGVAILLIIKLTEYTVIRRARKGEGIDYWLGEKDSELPFQDSARLEISGILEGNESKIKARVKQKKEQTFPTDGELPAYIAVIEFSKPVSHLEVK
ncbi:MAG: hypothetical protein MUC29_06570 [Pyrinomonadaceae bacterium]|jgi:hypothetical protein|nr:hypothetical protein [Pyrinomonadaceae bacterium]